MASDPEVLTVWAHGGTDAERAALAVVVEGWNDRRGAARVEVVEVPEGDYGLAVQTAAISGTLPDVLEVDGPLITSYAYQGALQPLDPLVDADVLASLLPSLREQGTVNGSFYAAGMFESGLGLFADRSRLEAAGVRVPTSASDAWTAAETLAALQRLAAVEQQAGGDGLVLDLKRSYGVGEWLTYGFSPLVASAGGEFSAPDDRSPDGGVSSEAAVAALTMLAGWAPFVDDDTTGDAFVHRRVPLSWVGHWEYETYREALGDDLVLLPLPDLGAGSRTGHGSWAWGVSATTERPQQAADFVAHLLMRSSVQTMTRANGAVPGTWEALASDDRFAVGGELAMYADNLAKVCPGAEPTPCVTVTRPRTPGYPTLSYAFAAAVDEVLRGQDPQAALSRAADRIERDTQLNAGWNEEAATPGPPELRRAVTDPASGGSHRGRRSSGDATSVLVAPGSR